MQKETRLQNKVLLKSQDLIYKIENQTGSLEVSLKNQTSYLKVRFDWLYHAIDYTIAILSEVEDHVKGIIMVHHQIEGKTNLFEEDCIFLIDSSLRTRRKGIR